MAKRKPAHYRGSYHVHSRWVRAQANANPDTRCWRCNLTLAERRVTHPQARWQAGHLVDGQTGGRLTPECSHCNASAGARLRNGVRTDLTW